ncbi:hypothetical protein SP19_106 [Salmonella phage 19]|nr:hypothetical protein SP19_106 [Salmonella phage 19]
MRPDDHVRSAEILTDVAAQAIISSVTQPSPSVEVVNCLLADDPKHSEKIDVLTWL